MLPGNGRRARRLRSDVPVEIGLPYAGARCLHALRGDDLDRGRSRHQTVSRRVRLGLHGDVRPSLAEEQPDGSIFFAAGLVLSLALLWPATAWIRECDGAAHWLARFGLRSLQLGIVLGVVVGLESLFFFDFSQIVRKGHEVLALLSFLSLYAGVPALQIHRVRLCQVSSWPTFFAIGPLVAIGLSQLGLYLDQRDLGWVDTSWREMGVPVWLSFAFWQWLATAALWASVGHLVVSGRSSRVKVPAQSRASENEPPGAAVRQDWTPG